MVICGGEPTLHNDLVPFIRRIRDLGFLVKLDTNGSHPKVLQSLFDEGLVNYVAMDVKHELDRYEEITPVGSDTVAMTKSIALIIASGVDHEFRTTVIGGIHDLRSVTSIARTVAGCQTYHLQNFRHGQLVDPDFSGKSFTNDELVQMRDSARQWVANTQIVF